MKAKKSKKAVTNNLFFVRYKDRNDPSVSIRAEYFNVDRNCLVNFYDSEGDPIAVFRDWESVEKYQPFFKDKLEKLRRVAEPNELPENWGKVT